MARTTAFHPRVAAAVTSFRWGLRSGFAVPRSYADAPWREAAALRDAVGVFDASASIVTELTGTDALDLLARLTTADVERLAVGRLARGLILDEQGRCVDEATALRLADDHLRLVTTEPVIDLAATLAIGLRADVHEADGIGTLTVRGPRAGAVVAALADGSLDVGEVRAASLGGGGWIARSAEDAWDLTVADGAIDVWDLVLRAGADHAILPVGEDAVEIARIEAGAPAIGAEWASARRPGRRLATPAELGVDGIARARRLRFVGQDALEAAGPPATALVGLLPDDDAIEALWAEHQLPAPILGPSRTPTPVYAANGRRQVGIVTSATWSPTYARPIALARLATGAATVGDVVRIEHTVEGERRQVPATVTRPGAFG